MSDLSAYHELIARKRVAFEPRGLTKVPALNSALKDHQAHVVDFALRAGSGAAFLDTGLGKTFVAQEFGRVIVEHTNKPVLMLAPLAVGKQHEKEAERFGIDAIAIREPEEVRGARVYVTNYERLSKFDPDTFAGVILDESSILKSFTGATTRALTDAFRRTPYRLACTATPAPNDHMELGQHSNFLGVMPAPEMLSRWFIADQTNMGRYRLKSAAVRPYWDWVASWARCVSKPSDLGYSDDGYILPDLNLQRHMVRVDTSIDAGAERDGQARLFRIPDTSATSIHKEKRLTIAARADLIAEKVAAEPDEPWVIWVDTDYEADAIMARLDAIEVRGSMSPDEKEERLIAFSSGQAPRIVTKPSIAGYGLNWQHCRRMAFPGLSFSYESFYQAVRRCWRFGQPHAVDVHIACAETEEAIWNVVSRKAGDHDAMKREMATAMRRASRTHKVFEDYAPERAAVFPHFLKEAA